MTPPAVAPNLNTHTLITVFAAPLQLSRADVCFLCVWWCVCTAGWQSYVLAGLGLTALLFVGGVVLPMRKVAESEAELVEERNSGVLAEGSSS